MAEDAHTRIVRESTIDTFSNKVERMTYATHGPTGIHVEHPVRLIAERELVALVQAKEAVSVEWTWKDEALGHDIEVACLPDGHLSIEIGSWMEGHDVNLPPNVALELADWIIKSQASA